MAAESDESVVVSSATDFSSDSTVSDDWQELTKSDYAKVIFSDLLCNTESGTVECKFQITDNVHEDPSDYVGLFRIGYEDLSQCLVSKMLSQTKCEDDGKLQRCVFTSNELPCPLDGFYQFLYVTRDHEVCGASMPFQINMPQALKDSSDSSSASENMDSGFLLVKSETQQRTQRKVKEEPSEPKKASVEQSASLSEQKMEEIAAWVSQNPDYHSLIEQIREHTFTIEALQQSKDLATREVGQLYDILSGQSSELVQLKNMLAAYEEKIKMGQSLQDEKNEEIVQLKNILISYQEKMSKDRKLQEETQEELNRVKSELLLREEKLKESISFQEQTEEKLNLVRGDFFYKAKKLSEVISFQDKKLEEMNRVKNELLMQEEELKETISVQDQQRVEIDNLKRELEEMKEMHRAKVAAESGPYSMDTVIQKVQDMVHIIGDTVKNLDFNVEDEIEKFYQLKIQLIILMKRLNNVTQLAITCDPTELRKMTSSVIEKDLQASSSAVCTPCALENRDPVEATTANATTYVEDRHDIPASSVESPSLPDSSEKQPTNDNASKEVVQRSSFNKSFESEALEHQIIELPRLDVINEDTAKALQTDKPLDAEDITVINRLTEKIIKRGFNLYDALELVDDVASDSESDASEISECSSIKKDILCLSRVMEALSSYLSNQTSLDHLIVVEKEEDKSLIHRNKWDELLQKCAFRYQIELLLEHIEKQRDGVKKVSEKICDLLTKFMMLQDEVVESKALCERLQSVIVNKDNAILFQEEQIELSSALLDKFSSENTQLRSRMTLADKTIEDLLARLMEATNLYKKQYTEIERLSKKLQKYKAKKDKTKSSKGESSRMSSDSSRTESSFEVVKKDSVQNISDSDTGEHMFQKASLVPKEKNQDSRPLTVAPGARFLPATDFKTFKETFPDIYIVEVEETQAQIDSNPGLKTVPEGSLAHPASSFDDVLPSNPELKIGESVTQTTSDKPSTSEAVECQLNQTTSDESTTIEAVECQLNQITSDKPTTSEAVECQLNQTSDEPTTSEAVECQSNQTTSLFSDFESYEHFQEVVKESFVNIKKPAASRNSQECSISCYICKEIIRLGPQSPIDLMNHLEDEHSMKTCPVCGQLFEEAIPPKYFQIHVERHFETQ